jgi:hypothetical protein
MAGLGLMECFVTTEDIGGDMKKSFIFAGLIMIIGFLVFSTITDRQQVSDLIETNSPSSGINSTRISSPDAIHWKYQKITQNSATANQ